jgi:hypothetical protein
MENQVIFVDLFAGGGGTSTGAFSIPGIYVAAAVNHDEIAIKTHAANHPETMHFKEDLWIMDEKRLPKCNVLINCLAQTVDDILKFKNNNHDKSTLLNQDRSGAAGEDPGEGQRNQPIGE